MKATSKRNASCVFLFALFTGMICSAVVNSAGVVNAGTLRMKYFSIIDRQMGGIPAFRVLAPADWRLHGGLTWNENLANLVTADVSITAPDGSAGLFVHPAPQYISGQIEHQWPRGKLYLGMVVMPLPNSPEDFVRQVVLPGQRTGARHIRLVQREALAAWAAGIAGMNSQPDVFTQGFGTRARFAYTENGRNWEEDFYCVVLVSRPRMGPQNLFWLADRNLSVRAEAGKVDAMKQLATAFVNSFSVEKRWYGRFLQVQQQWIAAGLKGIADAGALSRAISRSNDQFNQAIMDSWNRRQEAEDRANREFSEYIRGTENYHDPVNDTRIELPGGYDNAWTNVNGEYVLSDVPGFDPNRNSGSTGKGSGRFPEQVMREAISSRHPIRSAEGGSVVFPLPAKPPSVRIFSLLSRPRCARPKRLLQQFLFDLPDFFVCKPAG